MLDSELIQRKLNLIREDLAKLEDLKKFSFDELAKDWLKWNALEHIFMKIIGWAIDINEHLIAELAGAGRRPLRRETKGRIESENLHFDRHGRDNRSGKS